MGYLGQTGIFLIETLFGFFILAVLLRFLLQLVRGDFYNPAAQFLVTVTNPALKPLRRLIPGLLGIDVASVLLLMLLQGAKIYLVAWLLGATPALAGVAVYSLASLLDLTLFTFIIIIIIRIVVSWISPYPNPMLRPLTQLSEPLMRPARRLIPPISGIDLSPIAVLLALQVGGMLLIRPLLDLGRALMR